MTFKEFLEAVLPEADLYSYMQHINSFIDPQHNFGRLRYNIATDNDPESKKTYNAYVNGYLGGVAKSIADTIKNYPESEIDHLLKMYGRTQYGTLGIQPALKTFLIAFSKGFTDLEALAKHYCKVEKPRWKKPDKNSMYYDGPEEEEE